MRWRQANGSATLENCTTACGTSMALIWQLPELRAGVLDCPAAVVHGWHDDVVPYEHSVRFAHTYKAALHLLESDHRLQNQVRVIQYLFEYFLIALDLPAVVFE